MIRMHDQLLAQFTDTKNSDRDLTIRSQPVLSQCDQIDHCSEFEDSFQIFQIDFRHIGGEVIVRKTSLGHAADEGHLTAFKTNASLISRPAAGAFVPATGCL